MYDMTALELVAAIKEKKLSVPEVVSAYIEEIEKNDKQNKTFLTITKENALERAKEVQVSIDKGDALSSLAGIPIALKDNISTLGLETTCASKMLKGYKPVFNAAAVEKLESAGMIVIGKTNMDEFALGESCTARNPWDKNCIAGDGSVAAIAAGEVPIAIGSDTSGNLRQACSFCNVTGIKPTYGSVSRHGLIAYASSLDQIGPLGQDIEDCAALLSIISGPDKRDGTCFIDRPFEFGYNGKIQKGLKIGLPHLSNIDEEIKTAVLTAAKEYEEAGAVIEEFEMPLMDYIIPIHCIISSAEVSSNLAKYDGLKYGYRSQSAKTLSECYRLSRSEGFGYEVKRKIMFGSFVLSSGYYDQYFKKAMQGRELIKDIYNKLFERFDMILSPVTPIASYELNKDIDDPMNIYNRDIFTAFANLTGFPAVSLPCGFNKQGLPIGYQLIGNLFTENKLIEAARFFQTITNHHKYKPKKNSVPPCLCVKKNGVPL